MAADDFFPVLFYAPFKLNEKKTVKNKRKFGVVIVEKYYKERKL